MQILYEQFTSLYIVLCVSLVLCYYVLDGLHQQFVYRIA